MQSGLTGEGHPQRHPQLPVRRQDQLDESFNISIFWNDSEAVSNISLTVEFDFSIIRDLLLGLWDILDILDTLDLIQNG